MELRYIRSFVAVADALHFGQAAEQLKLAQPALSQHIQKLETLLETKLLDRNRHGVALTAVGQVFLREARTILAQVEHARNEVERVKSGGQGTLRLSYVPGPARGALTCALHTIRQKNPAVRVELHEVIAGNVMQRLLAGEVDAILGPELDPPFPRGLDHEEMAQQEVVLCLGRMHPLAEHKVIKLSDLKDAAWVIYSEDLAPGYRRWINQVCRPAGFRPRVAQRVMSSNDLQVALSTLPGVAIVPAGYRELFGEGVEFRSLDPLPEPMGLWLWWRKGDESSALMAMQAALRATGGQGAPSRAAEAEFRRKQKARFV